MKYKAILLLLVSSTLLLSAQQKPSQQWLDRKFSMFIHFGLYSVYGGVYEGKPVRRGYSEQIQSFAGIFSDWYGNTAKQFNPEQWDPDAVVTLAKEAGMRSIVFTSKHHDGFCMYHSQYTGFNIVDATPYGRDLMKELADACARGGIGFGVYYSLIDWHYPHAYPISSHNADPLTPEHYAYNLKQVEEIMTRYGDLSEIWFDMGSLTPDQSSGLYELVNRLQPGCMISGRLGNDYVDFSVMADNEYPDYSLAVPWQTAASVFDETWGYRSWQERGALQPKVEEKIESMIKVVSRGGNYLLNIGPRGDGSLVPFEQDLLQAMGRWLQANGEAVYGTEASPFMRLFPWGEVTASKDALYLFVKSEYAGKEIELDHLDGNIGSVGLLSSGASLRFRSRGGKETATRVVLPAQFASSYEVVKVAFRDGFSVIPENVVSSSQLTPTHAECDFGHSSLNYYAGYKSLLAYNWSFASKKKDITPEIYFTEDETGRSLLLEVDGTSQELTLRSSRYQTIRTSAKDVQWGPIYRKPGHGVFGFLDEEQAAPVSARELEENWEQITAFRYGEKLTHPLGERESLLFLQEIRSSRDQLAAVEIGSGNAVYILLNGRYLTAHFSPGRVNHQTETVLIPLQKGMNQLVIKYYNGFEKELCYSITPLREWRRYSQKLPTMQLTRQELHRLRLSDKNPLSKVSPLRMHNIEIKLYTKTN